MQVPVIGPDQAKDRKMDLIGVLIWVNIVLSKQELKAPS
jgi:hypothetical protein